MARIKTVLLLMMIFISTSTTIFASNVKNEPTGFNFIEWGTEISTLKDTMVFQQQKNNISYYTKANDASVINDDLKTGDILYGFKNGNLTYGIIYIKTLDQYIDILNTLTHMHGPGQTIGQRDQYGKFIPEAEAWFGDKTVIFLDRYSGDSCTLSYAVTPKYLSEIKQQAK